MMKVSIPYGTKTATVPTTKRPRPIADDQLEQIAGGAARKIIIVGG